MKLLCIKQSQPNGMPIIKKGETYTPTDIRNHSQLAQWAHEQGGKVAAVFKTMRQDGVWYELEEIGPDNWYHESHFEELATPMMMVKEGERGEPKKVVFFEE